MILHALSASPHKTPTPGTDKAYDVLTDLQAKPAWKAAVQSLEAVKLSARKLWTTMALPQKLI